jgi:hypothetical protein
MKHFGGALFAAWLALGCADAAEAQNVTISFAVHNSFGAAISLESASCSPRASIMPPWTIANNVTATFGASSPGGTLLCTVRYRSGAGGCQFQVHVSAVGRTTRGFASANPYKASGGRPSCGGRGMTAGNTENGAFTMQ